MRAAAAAAAAAAVALAAAATADAATVEWCSDSSATALLTYCGSACDSGDPCVQYLDSATCSNASRNACETSSEDSECTYQCLGAYNTAAQKWTLFIKQPASTDRFSSDSDVAFPSAPVDAISGVEFSESVNAIQITGFDDTDVQKGSTKSVDFESTTFDSVPVLEALVIENIDLSSAASGFYPSSVSTLMLDNCKLTSLPADISTMSNLVNLQLSKNYLSSVSTDYSSVFAKLTYLDLSYNSLSSFDVAMPAVTSLFLNDNSFTTFPSIIFNMTQLTNLNMDGNTISSLVVTQSEYNFLKRLSSNSTLGVVAASGSCGSDATEETVLGAVVCISTGDASSSSKDGGSGSSSTLIIVVVVLAAVIAVGLIAGFIFWRRRRRSRDHYDETRSPNATPSYSANNSRHGSNNGTAGSRFTGGGGGGNRGSTMGLRRKATQPSLGSAAYSEISKFAADMAGTGQSSSGSTMPAGPGHQNAIRSNVMRIPTEDINYTRTIAKGAFGEVWLASYGTDLVAVKKLLAVTPTGVGDFIAELNLLATLSHPRILALVGGCWDDQFTDLQIVLEYMDSGDLLTVLRGSTPAELTWESSVKATYCVQVCEAVYYLHSLQPALIHRDIKSRNILIDSRKGAKLSDFGESRERTFAHTMTAGVGTARWVAPEIILGEDYSELADIYSLGVLLTELDTHQIPYQTLGLDESMIVQQVAVGKLRPKVSETCPEVIRRLAHECLQFDPALRPSAARVLQTLMASSLVRRQSTALSA